MRRMLGLLCVLIGVFILLVSSFDFHDRDYRFRSEERIELQAPYAPEAPERPLRPMRPEYRMEMHHDHGAPWFIFRLIASFITVFTIGGMIAIGYMIYLKWKATQNPIHYV